MLGTSPKMTFSGSLPSEGGVWGPHGSCGAAGGKGGFLGAATREMSPVLGTSPKTTFFGPLCSRGGVGGTHGSCGVACGRRTCWEMQFGRCPQFLGHLPK